MLLAGSLTHLLQGTESTATQMKDYLVNLGKKIQGEVHHAGMEGIREQLVASFKQIGWDLAQNEPAGDLPTLKDLEKWLSGLVKTYFQVDVHKMRLPARSL